MLLLAGDGGGKGSTPEDVLGAWRRGVSGFQPRQALELLADSNLQSSMRTESSPAARLRVAPFSPLRCPRRRLKRHYLDHGPVSGLLPMRWVPCRTELCLIP